MRESAPTTCRGAPEDEHTIERGKTGIALPLSALLPDGSAVTVQESTTGLQCEVGEGSDIASTLRRVLGESLESDASEFFDSMPQAVLSLEGHAGFLVSALSAEGSAAGGCRALGAFFIGPAYPNRSSTRHVAQGLVITHPRHRCKGVGRLMARVMLALAVYMHLSIYLDTYIHTYIHTAKAHVRPLTRC